MQNIPPELCAKVTNLIEIGLNPDEIINHFREEDERKINGIENDDGPIPQEVYLIAQAFAYRAATFDDAKELLQLLTTSYNSEVDGPESFRQGEPISMSLVRELLLDSSYQWLIAEAPSGRGVEDDGLMVAVCCFTTSGVSRKNGIIEGALGSVRLFAVLPRYSGLCIGQRLLSKVEQIMFSIEPFCCRSMICIPSTRISVLKWIQRRGYSQVGSIPYPAGPLGHTLIKIKSNDPVMLVHLIKTRPTLLSADISADDKQPMVQTLVSASVQSAAQPTKSRPKLESSAVMVSQHINLPPVVPLSPTSSSESKALREIIEDMEDVD